MVQADPLRDQLTDDERQIGDDGDDQAQGEAFGVGCHQRHLLEPALQRLGDGRRRRRRRPARRPARCRSARWRGTGSGALASASAALAMRSPSSARCWSRTLRAATIAISDIAKTPLTRSNTRTITISVPTPPMAGRLYQPAWAAPAAPAAPPTSLRRRRISHVPSHFRAPRKAGSRPVKDILAAMHRGLRLALLALLATASPLAGQTRGLTPKDLFALRSVADVQVSPDGSRVAYSVMHNDGPGRPYAVVTILNLETGRSATLPRGASGPRWAPDGRRLAFIGQSAEGAGLMVSEADGSGARFLAPVEGTNHPLPSAGESVLVGARWTAHRLRLGHPGPRERRRQRRPDGDHALSLQADGRRGIDAVQRQSPHARLRRRRRHPPGLAAHRGGGLRALDRLGAQGRRDRLRLEPRSQPGSHVQLRRLHRVGPHQGRPPRHGQQERGVLAGVVARRHAPGLHRHASRSHLVGDDDGGHPRVGDERRRQRPGGARRRGGQPPGRAALVRRRPARVLLAAGAGRGAAGAVARHRRTARAGGQGPRQRRGVGPGPLGGRLRADHARRPGGSLHRRPRGARRSPSGGPR